MFFQVYVTNIFGYGVPLSGAFIITNALMIILCSIVILMIGMMSMYVFE